MGTKLTLSLDDKVIEEAKRFAKRQHRSLSKLVEGYLRQVTKSESAEEAITPLVAELSGVLSPAKVDKHKKEYADYLAEKYR